MNNIKTNEALANICTALITGAIALVILTGPQHQPVQAVEIHEPEQKEVIIRKTWPLRHLEFHHQGTEPVEA